MERGWIPEERDLVVVVASLGDFLPVKRSSAQKLASVVVALPLEVAPAVERMR